MCLETKTPAELVVITGYARQVRAFSWGHEPTVHREADDHIGLSEFVADDEAGSSGELRLEDAHLLAPCRYAGVNLSLVAVLWAPS